MQKIFFGKPFSWWRALHLVDRLLLIFMTILLAQPAHNLFFHELTLQDSKALDVVIRTTKAAIVGYFISAGFRGASEQDASFGQNTIGLASSSASKNAPMTPIGFAAEMQTGEASTQSRPARSNSTFALNRRIRQQLIVAIIGISSLLMLVIARNYAQPSAAAVATLSQLREFVCGGVGFLIGHAGSVRS